MVVSCPPPFVNFFHQRLRVTGPITFIVSKFSDDTTVIGLISHGDEGVYWRKVEHLAGWFSDNNLVLSVSKLKK